jgi:transcriptional regulator NrdR family protein
MVCIYCGKNTKIINSRAVKKTNKTWRRHRCLSCHSVFTTEEKCQFSSSLLFKSQNHPIEPFCQEKLYLSVYQAIDYLDQPAITASHLTETIINHLLKNKPRDPLISASEVKIAATLILKRFNPAAAIRYATFVDQKLIYSANDIKRFLKP